MIWEASCARSSTCEIASEAAGESMWMNSACRNVESAESAEPVMRTEVQNSEEMTARKG